jgi:hypothetical protein
MALGASTKQSAGVTILNRTRIKVESDATTRVDNLTTRKELHVKLRNMRNRRDMKRGSTNNASTNDWEGGTIGSENTNRRVDRSNRIQQGRILSHMKKAPVSRSHGDIPGEGGGGLSMPEKPVVEPAEPVGEESQASRRHQSCAISCAERDAAEEVEVES